MAGAHSDVGGGYHRNGLSNRTGNLMIDYLNALSDQPFLPKLEEPTDPRMNVVHRSEEHLLIYRLRDKADRQMPEGTIDRLVPQRQMRHVPDPFNPEPRDNALDARFDHQNVRIGPVPNTGKRADQARSTSLDSIIERLSQGAQQRNDPMMSAAVYDYLRSPEGAEFKEAATHQGQLMEARERQMIETQLLEQQQMSHAMHR